MNTLQQINYMQTNHAFVYSHDPKTHFDPRKKKADLHKQEWFSEESSFLM